MAPGAFDVGDDVVLKSLTEKGSKGGAMDCGGNTKVKNVEKAFMKQMGFKVQADDKKCWLAYDNATLASLEK